MPVKTCLIVDDSRVVRKIARHILEGMQFRVDEAENGRDGLDRCLAIGPDLVLLDWNMPKLSGLEFLKRLRRSSAAQPKVVFCSTENEAEKVRTALDAGADAYVMKPFDRETLASKIGAVLAPQGAATGAGFGRRSGAPNARAKVARSAERASVALPAYLETVGARKQVALIDVSRTGARLEGEVPHTKGTVVALRAGPIDAMATIAWSDRGACGVTFDEPISDAEVHFLAGESRAAATAGFSLDQTQAANDWQNGLVR